MISLVLGLVGCGPPPQVLPHPPGRYSKHIDLSMRFELKITKGTEWVRLLVAIPRTVPGRQVVSEPRLEGPAPKRIFLRNGTRFAEWVFERPEGDKTFAAAFDVQVQPSDFDAISSIGQPPSDRSPEAFLRSEAFVQATDPRIRRAAQSVALDPADGAVGPLKAVYRDVLDRLRNDGYVPQAQGAVKTLERGQGDCTDYTDLLVAMARARGVPARHVTGYVMTLAGSTPKHSWAELHSPTLGWIPVDPLWGDLGRATFERRPTAYVQLYDNRNEEVGNFWRYWSRGGGVKVIETLKIGPRAHVSTSG